MRTEIKKLLKNTGLRHEFTRITTLDTRILTKVEDLLPYADYKNPGDKKSLLIQELQKAAGKAKWHFNNSNPDIAASLACKEYLDILDNLIDKFIENNNG